MDWARFPQLEITAGAAIAAYPTDGSVYAGTDVGKLVGMTKLGMFGLLTGLMLCACGSKKENSSEDLFSVATNRSANSASLYGVWESIDYPGGVSGRLRIKITEAQFSYSLLCQNLKDAGASPWSVNGSISATIAGSSINYADKVRQRPPSADYHPDCKVRLKDAYNEMFSLAGGKLSFTYEFGSFTKISD